MKSEDCEKFDKCSAPLCPWDESSLQHGLWYPGEDLCNFQKANQVDWVRRQRKIAKKANKLHRFFTYKMLCRNCRVGSAIKGLDPDLDRAKQEQEWIAKHPEIVVTAEMRDRMRSVARLKGPV